MMKVSTRGRYALRLMTYLVQHGHKGYVSLKEIADCQGLTVRYLEQIISILLKAGYVQSLRGKTGGYRLTKDPSEYTTADILKLTEGDSAPVACLTSTVNSCPRAKTCTTLPFWQGLHQVVEEYLKSVTLADLANDPHPIGCYGLTKKVIKGTPKN